MSGGLGSAGLTVNPKGLQPKLFYDSMRDRKVFLYIDLYVCVCMYVGMYRKIKTL